MQIAKFQVGPADMCQVVTIDQAATDLFIVYSAEVIDGEASLPASANFANAQLAFAHALRLVQTEVEDVCDTVGG